MKRALRIAFGVLAVYLAVSFIYTAVDMAPWKPHHVHDMFAGRGVFLFFSVYPAFGLYQLFARVTTGRRWSSCSCMFSRC